MFTLEKFLLMMIFIIGFFFRFYNLNWDQNQHLHPDERFLTMVGTAMRLPTSLGEYLDPARSKLNPYNIGYDFYVYGVFPVVLNKFIAVQFWNDDYNSFTLQGRALSAIFSLFTALIIYKLTATLLLNVSFFKKTSATELQILRLIPATLFVINFFSIQQAHFFTVESFLIFFISLGVFFAVKGYYAKQNELIFYFFSTTAFAFALACKIIAILFLPILAFLMIAKVIHKIVYFNSARLSKISIFVIFSLFLIAWLYILFRFLQPFYFAGSNFFDIKINPQTIKNFDSLKGMDNSESTFPPSIQWQTKQSIIWPFQQLFWYGLNPMVTLFAFISLSFTLFLLLKKKLLKDALPILLIIFIILSYFLYQGTRFTMNMRYFFPLYPLILIILPMGIYLVIKNARIRNYIYISILTFSTIWTVAFMNIYIQKNTRIAASEWIYANILPGSIIAVEHWDDALPLSFDTNPNNQFNYVEIPIFIPDSAQKWQQLKDKLSQSDYYIMSSNRAWGSIPYYSKLYPQSKFFYEKIKSGDLGIKEIKRFVSRPGIGLIELNDDMAEESFTVYDHPIVIIYQVVDKQKLNTGMNKLIFSQ